MIISQGIEPCELLSTTITPEGIANSYKDVITLILPVTCFFMPSKTRYQHTVAL